MQVCNGSVLYRPRKMASETVIGHTLINNWRVESYLVKKWYVNRYTDPWTGP